MYILLSNSNKRKIPVILLIYILRFGPGSIIKGFRINKSLSLNVSEVIFDLKIDMQYNQ